MTRLVFKAGAIKDYLSSSRKMTGLSTDELASKLEISGRTLRDWQRDKFLPSKEALDKLTTLTKIPFPTPIETREDWWSGRVNGRSGAMARLKKYGCSYSIEKRKLGGQNSQSNRKLYPEYYAKLGCPIPREFSFPKNNSVELAEFIGILLGDGCIQSQQVSITLNTVADKDYIEYVTNQIHKLFNYSPTVRQRWPTKATTILISGKDFTRNLVNKGMKVGDKVKQQVAVPGWITKSHKLSVCCLRGLMDTDGGIFTHTYKIKDSQYSYLKINFSNKSQPLREFAYNTLKQLGLTPKYRYNNQVWLYSEKEVISYIKLVGSSNQRLLKKIR